MSLPKEHITGRILENRLMAIVRLKLQSQVATAISCLVEGGVAVVEITANTPGYCQEITTARAR